jgi:hypothetical protein
VDLAVQRADAGGVDDRGAVVQAAVAAVLGEPADDHEVVGGRAVDPARDGRAVRGLGERACLGGVREDVARRDELGQDHDLRAGRRGGVQRGDRPGAVAVQVPDHGRELVAGDAHGAHGRDCTRVHLTGDGRRRRTSTAALRGDPGGGRSGERQRLH